MRLDVNAAPVMVRPGDTLVVGLRDRAAYEAVSPVVIEEHLPGVKVLVVRADHLAVFRPDAPEIEGVTMPSDETAELLSTDLYEQAFTKAMSGNDAVLTDEERTALRRAKELTGTTGPGYPMPARLDPTRNRTE